MRVANRAQSAGDHDRLVVAAHLAAIELLEGAEVAADGRPAELVVERGGADRAVDHDLQRGHDPARLADVFALPGLHQAGHAQMRDAEPDQSGLRPRPAPDGALVANLATRSRRRARIRSDGGRMVVGLDLHQDVRGLIMCREPFGAGFGKEAAHAGTAKHRRVVGIRAENVVGRRRIRRCGESCRTGCAAPRRHRPSMSR